MVRLAYRGNEMSDLPTYIPITLVWVRKRVSLISSKLYTPTVRDKLIFLYFQISRENTTKGLQRAANNSGTSLWAGWSIGKSPSFDRDEWMIWWWKKFFLSPMFIHLRSKLLFLYLGWSRQVSNGLENPIWSWKSSKIWSKNAIKRGYFFYQVQYI